MIRKRLPYLRADPSVPVGKLIVSIAVGSIAGAAAAIPGSIFGVFIAVACLPGPVSGEIALALPMLAGLGGAIFGLPCGTIGWISSSAAGQRGVLVVSVTLAVTVAALGAAVLYGLQIAPHATVPEHSVLIGGIALTIGVGVSGAVSALTSRAICLRRWRKSTNQSQRN